MRKALRLSVFAAALAAMLPGGLDGQERRGRVPDPATADSLSVYLLEPLLVRGRIDDLVGVATSASQGFVGYRDISLRPLAREGELLETVPGMIVTQHSGSGKSNQMFVRGFNLDHGTDFSTTLEEMPLNLPSHAHGQGYTDLNFLIPELVDHVEYSLGNYYADIGDFGSAGGAQIRLRRVLDRPLFGVGSGQGGFRRMVGAASLGVGERSTLLVGGEAKRYDGPWDKPEDLQKLSGTLRYTWQGETSSVSVLGLAYDNAWQATDQIPLRAVEGALLGRFGQVDSTLGGESHRYSLSGTWTRSTGASSQHVAAYAVRYGLDLFSNFTYLLDDPAGGDQFRQQDDGRWTLGMSLADVRTLELGGRTHTVEVGGQMRRDRANLTLSRTRARVAMGTVRFDRVTQWSGGLHARLESRWSPLVRTEVGLRGDAYGFAVDSDRVANSGSESAGIVSPKLSVAFVPGRGAEVYASTGLGFHSNDARGVVQTVDPLSGEAVNPVDPLVRSRGAELGLRVTPTDGLRHTVALWWVELDSELQFVGDAGTTEASDPSRRLGLTLTSFYRLGTSWTADADLSLAHARFIRVPSARDRIPGAVESVLSTGVSRAPRADGVFFALRLRRLGTYPLTDDNARRATPSALTNLNVGYRWGDTRFFVSVLNLLNERDSDIQYYYRSRLRGEAPGGIEDVHFHPAEPRQVRIGVTWGTPGA